MSTIPTATTLDPRYSAPTASAPPWIEVEELLTNAELYWLTTVRRDGRPHVTPLVGVWRDGTFAFCTSVGEQKQHNLRVRTDVAVTTGRNTWASGTDVVVTGTARRVTGRRALEPLAAAWRDKYGSAWPWHADDEGFHADGETPPRGRPWVYAVTPSEIFAFGKDPHSQTTYRF